MSKSAFKVIAETVIHNPKVDFPTESLDPVRRITKEELAKIVKEEFAKAKSAEDTKAKEVDSWADAEIAKAIDWVKTLKLKEEKKPEPWQGDSSDDRDPLLARHKQGGDPELEK